MPSEELPTLDHGIPPPETYLPGTPLWYWWAAGVGAMAVILLLHRAWQILKPAPRATPPPKEDLFGPAMASLEELESSCGREDLSVIAARASLAVRVYLADSRSEPALYETAEEFQARQGILPSGANALLDELAEAKYAQSGPAKKKARGLIVRSRTCLEKLHRTDPEKAPPPELPEIKRHFTEWIHGLLPLGLAVSLAAFLIDLYDGTDTGSEIKINLVSWIALPVGTLGLLAKMTFRPPS